ncbi:cysteine desulfuration protein SufE [Candidatus Fukatsuia anoeciicola]|uniref:cysteine desulfuration protein SufE n=1 Tax=Candidatus Fukatsuia anoeciicola TaxID=2994492 RepID=UPI00346488D6
MAILPSKQKLLANFNRCLNWEEKYRYIIELGMQLPALTKEQRQPQNLIAGCYSQVWISVTLTKENQVLFAGDSDTVIVKGLMAIVFILYQNLLPEQIIKLDIQPFFSELALSQHLTPHRSQGLESMVRAIYTAVVHLT